MYISVFVLAWLSYWGATCAYRIINRVLFDNNLIVKIMMLLNQRESFVHDNLESATPRKHASVSNHASKFPFHNLRVFS